MGVVSGINYNGNPIKIVIAQDPPPQHRGRTQEDMIEPCLASLDPDYTSEDRTKMYECADISPHSWQLGATQQTDPW